MTRKEFTSLKQRLQALRCHIMGVERFPSIYPTGEAERLWNDYHEMNKVYEKHKNKFVKK